MKRTVLFALLSIVPQATLLAGIAHAKGKTETSVKAQPSKTEAKQAKAEPEPSKVNVNTASETQLACCPASGPRPPSRSC